MVNSEETERQTGREDVVAQAKEEINRRIEKINQNPEEAESEKKELAEELREKLKSLKLKADEVLEEEKKISRGERVFSQKNEERKELLFNVVQMIEAANQGVRVAKTDEAQAILEQIAKSGQRITASFAANIVSYLSEYIIGDKPIVDPSGKLDSEFVSKIRSLSERNRPAAELIREALRQAKERGVGSLGRLSPEEIEKLLPTEKQRSKNNFLNSEEQYRRGRIFRNISDRIQREIKDLPSLPEEEREKRGEAINMLQSFLLNGELNDQVLEAASTLGISEKDIKDFAQLTDKVKAVSLDFGIMESYAPSWTPLVRQLKDEFNWANLQKYFEKDEKGRLTLSREDRLALKEKIRYYYYQGLKAIHAQPSETYHTVLQGRQDIQYYFIMLHQVISHSLKPAKDLFSPYTDKESQELLRFFEDLGGNFLTRITSQAQIFHDMPLLCRDLGTVEKLIEFFRYIYPTQLAEIFDDREGKNYMIIARDLMTMMLREHLVVHGNIYDGSLLSGSYKEEGVFWDKDFKEEYKERLRGVLKKIEGGIEYLEKNDWIIDMITTYAEGIGIATLIDGEILATSKPVTHFREVHPLMSLLSAKHNWMLGRGGKVIGLINKYLLSMGVTLYPEKRPLWKRILTKKWNPKTFVEEVDKDLEYYGDVIVDGIFRAGALFQQLLAMLNLPNSLNSWDGWRIESIPNEFDKLYERLFKKSILKEGKGFSNQEWQQAFDVAFKLYGTSFLWWSIKGKLGRVDSEIAQRLKNLGFTQEQISRLKKYPLEARILIDFDGKKREVNYLEFEQLKLDQRQGELFFRYLRRNPGDFLMIFYQICPEVFELEDWQSIFLFDERFAPGVSEKNIESSLKGERKNKDEIRKFINLRRAFLSKWTDSYETLKLIHEWFTEISKNEEFADFRGEGGKFDRAKFFKKISEASAIAYERRKRANEKIRREILSRNTDQFHQLQPYVAKEDFRGYKTIWEIFAGEDGLFKKLTGLDISKADEFFANFGGVENEGKKTIFFDIAHNWLLENGEMNPFSADFPYYEVFNAFRLSGESAIKRTFEANVVTYKEVISKVANLAGLLLDAANSQSLGGIISLHKSIYDTLSGLMGEEYAWRANYILSQIVAGFFAEHSIARSPFINWLGPLGWLVKGSLGGKIALSRILTQNINAYTMDTNGLVTYFEQLRELQLINPERERAWGLEQLNRVFEASNPEYILGNVVPNVLWSIALFMLFIYLKKALEEAEGKGK